MTAIARTWLARLFHVEIGGLAVAAAIAWPAAAQESLGRLFFTPGERAQITAARVGGALPAQAAALPTPAAPQEITLSGVVLRTSGAGLIAWLDGRQVADGAVYAGWRVRILDAAVVLSDAGGRRLLVPVGRTVALPQGVLVDRAPRIVRHPSLSPS